MAEREKGTLEAELQLLSRAMLGKSLNQLSGYAELESTLMAGHDPVTLTFQSGDERQSLVLHELRDGMYKLFDPTHELYVSLKDDDYTIEPDSSAGMLWVKCDVVKSWFEERSAVALVTASSEQG